MFSLNFHKTNSNLRRVPAVGLSDPFDDQTHGQNHIRRHRLSRHLERQCTAEEGNLSPLNAWKIAPSRMTGTYTGRRRWASSTRRQNCHPRWIGKRSRFTKVSARWAVKSSCHIHPRWNGFRPLNTPRFYGEANSKCALAFVNDVVCSSDTHISWDSK